ncbi:MAG: hypothetical protein Q8N88_04765 [Nanoarchaeota archaeon]|nr:hypothetical protein [Nanoarchaeota archaeon]
MLWLIKNYDFKNKLIILDGSIDRKFDLIKRLAYLKDYYRVKSDGSLNKAKKNCGKYCRFFKKFISQ